MDHLHHPHAPLHWGYSGTAVAHPHSQYHPHHHHPQNNTWVPPPTTTTPTGNGSVGVNTPISSRKLKRAMSESDCEDLYSEESSKEQTSPGESDSCHMMSRKKRRGVIEKKRRDRINLSLCELKRLVPSAYEKQGSAKLEKAEILQLTVDHLKTMHSKGGSDGMPFDAQRFAVDYHIVGFRECATEVARYLVTMEGMDIQDPLRLRLMSHLQCFVAQRELQLKSNSGDGNDLLSPAPISISASSSSATVSSIVSPNMGQSATNWSAPTSSYHHPHHQQGGYHQMTTPTYQQNAYAAQTAHSGSGGGGYVPNLPLPLQQYDQYGNQRSATATGGDATNSGNYGTDTNSQSTAGSNSTSRAGVTTRSQSSSNNNSVTVVTGQVVAVAGTNSSDVNSSANGDQSGPTYIDLSTPPAAPNSTTPVSSAEAAATSVSSASAGNNHRLQNNYNIYGHIHYPADPTTGYYHGYNLHLDPSRGGGYNGVQGNAGGGGGGAGGNAKPYRPWGAEMAY